MSDDIKSLGVHYIMFTVEDVELAISRIPTRIFVVHKVDFKNPLESIVEVVHEVEL